MNVLLDEQALGQLMPLHLRTDSNGVILSVGPTLQKMRPNCELTGKILTDVFDIRRPRNFDCCGALWSNEGLKLNLAFQKPPHTEFKGVVVQMADPDGALINLSFGISVVEAVADYNLTVGDFAVTDLAVEMLYLFEAKTVVMDELRSLNQRLQGAKIAAEEQAFTDTLTGLKNRRAMEFVLSRLVETVEPFALMHLDLDFFKAVNDTYGHAAGDQVLQQVARILVAETRKNDVIVRYGGDEFVLILKGLVNPNRMRDIANRIIARLQEPIAYGNSLCRISGSIGMAVSTRYDTPDPEIMLKDADQALYRSKSEGRARSNFAEVAQ